MFQKPDKKYGFVGYCLLISIKECVKILHIQSKFGNWEEFNGNRRTAHSALHTSITSKRMQRIDACKFLICR